MAEIPIRLPLGDLQQSEFLRNRRMYSYQLSKIIVCHTQPNAEPEPLHHLYRAQGTITVQIDVFHSKTCTFRTQQRSPRSLTWLSVPVCRLDQNPNSRQAVTTNRSRDKEDCMFKPTKKAQEAFEVAGQNAISSSIVFPPLQHSGLEGATPQLAPCLLCRKPPVGSKQQIRIRSFSAATTWST